MRIRGNKVYLFTLFLLMFFDELYWFLVLFSDWKKETQKGTLKMALKVIPRKTLLAYNIDEERKDKYERKLYS